MRTEKQGRLLQADIHGMTAAQAKRELERLLGQAGPAVEEIVVIHGYNGGQVLRELVQKRLKHPRIAARLLCLNPGETRLLLKK